MTSAYEVLLAHGVEIPKHLDDVDACVLAVRQFITPDQIERLESVMLNMEQVEIPVEHRFADGVYGRMATFPKGTFAIGHAHHKDCHNIVLKGKVAVAIEGVVTMIEAPCVFTSKAYDRKVGYVLEELVWLTVHATEETDLELLEKELIWKSPAFLAHEARMKLKGEMQGALV